MKNDENCVLQPGAFPYDRGSSVAAISAMAVPALMTDDAKLRRVSKLLVRCRSQESRSFDAGARTAIQVT